MNVCSGVMVNGMLIVAVACVCSVNRVVIVVIAWVVVHGISEGGSGGNITRSVMIVCSHYCMTDLQSLRDCA